MEHRLNRVLTIGFAALLALNVAYLVMGFASIPVYFERVRTLTIPPNTTALTNYPTNESIQQRAAELGLTVTQFAFQQILFHSAFVLLFLAVALLIVWRARWNWFAWFSAFFLVFIAEFAFLEEIYVASLLPLWVYELGSLFWPLIVLYFYLFPNGKPAPRRALWIIAPAVTLHFIFQALGVVLIMFPGAMLQSVFDTALGVFQALIVGIIMFTLGCQVYRYLRISTREEKQQTKWFLLGLFSFILLSTINEALPNPYQDDIDLLIFAFVPLSVGIAILRYRLFDIDIIIRRTLIYSIITAMLVLTYFGSVVILQQIFRSLTGAGDDLAIIISTLAIAALFNPLRYRVQDIIDHRFYRRKYDAQQVLARFAQTARDEVELEKLSDALVDVVGETMQPTQVSLWLKK